MSPWQDLGSSKRQTSELFDGVSWWGRKIHLTLRDVIALDWIQIELKGYSELNNTHRSLNPDYQSCVTSHQHRMYSQTVSQNKPFLKVVLSGILLQQKRKITHTVRYWDSFRKPKYFSKASDTHHRCTRNCRYNKEAMTFLKYTVVFSAIIVEIGWFHNSITSCHGSGNLYSLHYSHNGTFNESS